MADLANTEKNRSVIEGPSGTDLIVNPDGSLNVVSGGGSVVSSLNSTSTPLAANGVFTGTSEVVTSYATISIAVFSNVASATNGLSIQFSTDNTNWDHLDVYTINANTGKIFTVGSSANYFRIVYTNNNISQTTFRLQTVFKSQPPKPSSHRVQDTIITQDDAELVKAVLTGEDSLNSGQFLNVKTNGGRLLVSQEILTPIGTTFVTKNEFGDVSSTAGVNSFYTITNGKTLTLQRLTGAAENDSFGSLIELFEDPNGDLSVLNRIETVIANGTTFQTLMAQSFVGNGTRRIVLRRRGQTSQAREIWGRWEGFEQ